MKILKIVPLLAVLITLSACKTAPGSGGGSRPDVIVKPGDNLDDSGYIKPDAGSTTTQEFLALFDKGFRGTDLKTLAIESKNGTHTITMDGRGTVATLDSLKSSTEAIFRMEMPVGNAGTVTAIRHMGIVVGQKTVEQAGYINDYNSEYPGDSAPDDRWKAFYTKVFAKSNINWETRDGVLAALAPAPDELTAFVAKVNAADLEYRPSGGTTAFTLAADGSFTDIGSQKNNIFYIVDNNTARYVAGMGSSTYGLRGAKFGQIQYEFKNDQQTSVELPITFPTAVKKANAVDAAALAPLKAALAGTYTPITINYPSGGGGNPTTNERPGDAFTINADGSFTDAKLSMMGMDKTITGAVLHSARSATEGRYSATIDGSSQHIGLEIINGMLYTTSYTPGGIDDINWFQLSPVAKKQ